MRYMGEHLHAYTRHLHARALRPNSVDAYLGWLRRLADWNGGPIDDLTTDDLEQWIADHPAWKPNTHAKAVQAAKAYYAWLAATGRRADDPGETLRPARAPRAVANPCPEELYQAALARAHGCDWWRLRLAAETGLRRAELAAVHSGDVHDLVTGPCLRVHGKGGVVRWVPLPADLAAWIRMQRGHVFWTRDGGHITPSACGHWYHRVLGMHVHALRHRYATMAYHQSHDINAVSKLLGHADVSTTQIYVDVPTEDLVAAASGAWDHAA